ncbi:MAG: hypothetical protein ACTSRI_02105 [Promethearchaeota archaeon]
MIEKNVGKACLVFPLRNSKLSFYPVIIGSNIAKLSLGSTFGFSLIFRAERMTRWMILQDLSFLKLIIIKLYFK